MDAIEFIKYVSKRTYQALYCFKCHDRLEAETAEEVCYKAKEAGWEVRSWTQTCSGIGQGMTFKRVFCDECKDKMDVR